MEYYSAIKKDEIMPFAVTWMDLETALLNELSQTVKGRYHMISIICEILKKKGKTKLILKTEIVSQMQKTNSWLPRGKREGDKLGNWDLHTDTATCNR